MQLLQNTRGVERGTEVRMELDVRYVRPCTLTEKEAIAGFLIADSSDLICKKVTLGVLLTIDYRGQRWKQGRYLR